MSETYYTLDCGNTNCTLAKYQGSQPTLINPLDNNFDSNSLGESPIYSSSVTKIPEILKSKKSNFISLNKYKTKNQFLSMPISYSETLGEDRLFAAFSIFESFVSYNQLMNYIIIDAGTYLTVDLVNSSGLEGGHISPGINTQLKSFSTGHQLPLVTSCDFETYLNKGIFPCWPSNTMTAILETVRKQNLSFIETITKQVIKSEIILTGGDASLLALLLSTSTTKLTVKTLPYLVHSGLNQARSFLVQSKEN
jgi:type III pantothenate kinase